jgi:hypothetical protein
MLFMTAPGAANADEALASALEQSGYFTGLDAAQKATLRANIVSDGYVGAMRHDRRVALTNTQLFATGGVGAWIKDELTPLLASRGVTFRAPEDRYAPDGSTYSVAVGTNEYTMWRAGEANPEHASTVAAFAMVNQLLESIGAPERLYLMGQGATAEAWLLTPVQADIIRAAAPPEARPQLPGQVMPAVGTMPALTTPPPMQPAQAAPTQGASLPPQATPISATAQPAQPNTPLDAQNPLGQQVGGDVSSSQAQPGGTPQ